MRDPAARYRVACESLTPNYVSSIYYYLMYLSIGGFVYFDAHGGVCKVYSLLGSALGLGLGLCLGLGPAVGLGLAKRCIVSIYPCQVFAVSARQPHEHVVYGTRTRSNAPSGNDTRSGQDEGSVGTETDPESNELSESISFRAAASAALFTVAAGSALGTYLYPCHYPYHYHYPYPYPAPTPVPAPTPALDSDPSLDPHPHPKHRSAALIRPAARVLQFEAPLPLPRAAQLALGDRSPHP